MDESTDHVRLETDDAPGEPPPEWVAAALAFALPFVETDWRPPASAAERTGALVRAIHDDPASDAIKRPGMEEEAWKRWRERLVRAVGHVQEGLFAAHFHAEAVANFEERIVGIFRSQHGKLADYPGTGGMFSSRALRYEYQAFLFAERRTLEYLAVAAAGFFSGAECHRIKGLKKAVRGKEPATASARLIKRLDDELADFGLSAEGYKSDRDRLAHWEAVDAGYFNISRRGDQAFIKFMGYGELPEFDEEVEVGLSAELRARAQRLEQFILDVFADLGILDAGARSGDG